jgi:signal transduction histidine kinase
MATILVVDDRDADRQYLAALLEHSGHRVIQIDDAAKAIAESSVTSPDLVITDIVMPAMDGFELVRRLRTTPRTSGMPVIFYSSVYDERSVHTLVYNCRPASLVAKGSNSKTILQAIQQALECHAKPASVMDHGFRDAHLELITTTLHGKIADLERTNTELRRANRELQEANTALQQFAYSAAHDLQEPARNIVNAAQMLFREYGDQLTGAGAALLNECIAGSLRMHNMIKGLLAYSTVLENSADGNRRADANANEVLGEVLQKFSSLLRECEADVAAEILPILAVERKHVALLFENIIDNCLKYRNPAVRLRIRISAAADGDFWAIRVSDNGTGFKPEYAERVFRLFKRLHARDQHAAAGVGLALCARVVAHYGGGIWAEGAPDRGATFTFTLPGGSET